MDDLPVNDLVVCGAYTCRFIEGMMMVTRIIAAFAAFAAASAASAPASAQIFFPSAPQGYPAPVPPGGYAQDYRRGPPGQPQDFDALEDDDDLPSGSTARGNAALPPPGPVMSPNDPAPPPQAREGSRPNTVMASLPPDEQPETGKPKELPPHLKRQEVNYVTKEPPGTIVVDTANTHLYYVLGGGRAIRYGVRVGRDGFTWSGVQKVTRKAEWPDWHPPTEMIERQPYLPRFMAGGDGNPMGARAMYLGNTVYRIHGTNQPSTIGQFVSSGCVGMLNEDVTDLFERVKVGTRVVVIPGERPGAMPATASAQSQGGYTPSPAYGDRMPPQGGYSQGVPAQGAYAAPAYADRAPPMPPGAASRMDATAVEPLPPPVTIR